MVNIARIQTSFARKAVNQPEHRFCDLYSLICSEAWIEKALDHVLSNQGSRTAGVDGVTIRRFADQDYRAAFIAEIQCLLRERRYRPQPCRRVYIPKADGKRRPLGIPTLRDRVVQMELKMLLEPIYESDFLSCSYGFRPGRRTMDAVSQLWSYIQPHLKFYWIIEGDIRGCFDNISHHKLMGLLKHRVGDGDILDLVWMFLRAGVMEEDAVTWTEMGTPQGGIFSPLLANIYLHELDRFWREQYDSLPRNQKAKRRRTGGGNVRLLRYADDFVLLWNGTKQGAQALKECFATFLRDELHLELSAEKTLVTHVDEGFDFLGFHARRCQDYGRPVLIIWPSRKSVERFKDEVRALTDRATLAWDAESLVTHLNLYIRGWGYYYRHCSISKLATTLDGFVWRRVLYWLCKKHGCGPRTAWTRHVRRVGGRNVLAVPRQEGGLLPVTLLRDIKVRRYPRCRRIPHPFLADDNQPGQS
jgi:group II intron reverse transcriptase/maturase